MSKYVKFKRAGRWARANVRAPHYSAEKGEVKELDDASAKIVVDAEAAEYVDPPEPEPEKEETSEEEAPEGEGSEEGKGGLLQRRGRRKRGASLE